MNRVRSERGLSIRFSCLKIGRRPKSTGAQKQVLGRERLHDVLDCVKKREEKERLECLGVNGEYIGVQGWLGGQ